MNRRGFLGRMLGALAAAVLPSMQVPETKPAPVPVDFTDRLSLAWSLVSTGCYGEYFQIDERDIIEREIVSRRILDQRVFTPEVEP